MALSNLFGLGRQALLSAAQALPDGTPGSVVEHAFADGSARAREGLFAAVERAAFALGLETKRRESGARVTLPDEHATAVPGVWPFGETAWRACFDGARATLSAEAQKNGIARIGPDELGAVYEGLLALGVELARVPSAVLSLPRSAGGAQLDRLVASERLTSAERRRATVVKAGRVALVQSADRRRSGSHYTPRTLTERVVAATLGPLVGDAPAAETVLSLRVCDPSLGTGAFLLAACRYLARRLAETHGVGAADYHEALRRVAERCLFGIDRDRLAIETACHALALLVGGAEDPLVFFGERLKVGDALVGAPATTAIPDELLSEALD